MRSLTKFRTAARLQIVMLSAAIAVTAGAGQAFGQAQSYPNRPITWIVGGAAGSIADITTRLLAEQWGKALGQQVLIDNKPGAGQIISMNAVKAARPDGYVVGYGSSSTHAIYPSLYKQLSYDATKDFISVHGMNFSPLVMLVPSNGPYKSVDEVVAAARAKPGEIKYSHTGIGSSSHLAPELLQRVTGIKLRPVPYKTSVTAVTDARAGMIDVIFDFLGFANPLLQDGTLRALAITGDKRLPSLPDVPTMAEAGYPGVLASAWTSLIVPAGTPKEVVEKLSKTFGEALRSEPMRAYAAKVGTTLFVDLDHQKMPAFVAAETEKYKEVLVRAGVANTLE